MHLRHSPLLLALLLPACADSSAPPPPPATLDVGTPLGVEIIEVFDEGVTVELVNGRDADADVAVNVNVASGAGIAQAHGLEVVRLAPFERLAIVLPRDEVPVFAGAAQLSVTADASFADGVRRTPTSPPFAVVADGGRWRAGDDDAALASARPLRDRFVERDRPGPIVVDPTASLVITRRLCVRASTQYEDAGVGEDFWTNTGPTFRTVRGADVEVTRAGTTFSGRLGDGLDGSHAGCIEISGRGFKTGDLVNIKVFSSGRVNGHDIRVENESTGSRAFTSTTVSYTEQTDAWYDVTPGTNTFERINIYMAASYAMFRHGGLAGASVTIHADATGGTRAGTSDIYIADSEDDEKFSIAHEVGHYIARNSNANFGNGSVCDDYRTGAGKACDSASAHTLTSKELVRCAATEGFGDFYAADVFNDHDETDCFVTINGSPTVDCQVGNAGFPEAMMEANCTTPYAGYGVETDWMRVFWDVHTRGSDEPTMNDVLRWMEDADDTEAWTNTNVYDLLNAEATRKGGKLGLNWHDVKDTHGIDHPVD